MRIILDNINIFYLFLMHPTDFMFSTTLNLISNTSTNYLIYLYINFRIFIRNCRLSLGGWFRFEPANKPYQYNPREKVWWWPFDYSRSSCPLLFPYSIFFLFMSKSQFNDISNEKKKKENNASDEDRTHGSYYETFDSLYIIIFYIQIMIWRMAFSIVPVKKKI